MGDVEWYSWGSGGAGLLCHGSLDDRHSPTLITSPPFAATPSSFSFSGVTSLACSGVYSLACTADGRLFHCGDPMQSTSTYRAQGEEAGRSVNLRVPTPLSFPHAVASVTCGWSHCGCLTVDGRLFMWGDNRRGQLGLTPPSLASSLAAAPPDFVLQPALVPLPGLAAEVACGWRHSLAVLGDGRLLGWGEARQRQLGLLCPPPPALQSASSSQPSHSFWSPTAIPLSFLTRPSRVRFISCGWAFSLLLSSAGDVFACGANQWNQCAAGVGTRAVSQWQKVEGLPPIAEVACGWSHAVARDEAGGVWTWGRRSMGQAGDGRFDEVSGAGEPRRVQIGDGRSATAVRCGSESCAAVDAEGQLWSWGWNEHGNVGAGDGDEDATWSRGCVWRPRLIEVGAAEDGRRRRVVDVVAGGASVFARVEVDPLSSS